MPRWLKIVVAVLASALLLLPADPLDSGVRRAHLPASTLTALDEVTRLLQYAETDVAPDRIEIRGVADAGDVWSNAYQAFRDSVPGHIDVVTDIFVIDRSMELAGLCRRMFSAMPKGPVRFHESTTTLRQSSYAALDRIADFTRDCRDLDIAITGHSDSTGHEAANVSLSKARAQAVADYLVARGAARERLIVNGVGSAQPIADDTTAIGREKNRRIEFGLPAAPD